MGLTGSFVLYNDHGCGQICCLLRKPRATATVHGVFHTFAQAFKAFLLCPQRQEWDRVIRKSLSTKAGLNAQPLPRMLFTQYMRHLGYGIGQSHKCGDPSGRLSVNHSVKSLVGLLGSVVQKNFTGNSRGAWLYCAQASSQGCLLKFSVPRWELGVSKSTRRYNWINQSENLTYRGLNVQPYIILLRNLKQKC